MTQQYISGYLPENFKTFICKDTCTPMFTAALSTVAKPWIQTKCPSADDWLEEMWCRHTVGHDSATRKDEILPFATTSMDLENIVLSEINQS